MFFNSFRPTIYPLPTLNRNPKLRYKVYDYGDNFAGVPEGERVFDEADETMTFYMVVSYVEYQSASPLNFTVWAGE